MHDLSVLSLLSQGVQVKTGGAYQLKAVHCINLL